MPAPRTKKEIISNQVKFRLHETGIVPSKFICFVDAVITAYEQASQEYEQEHEVPEMVGTELIDIAELFDDTIEEFYVPDR